MSMPTPSVEYALLSPMLIVFGVAVAGVLFEAFVPRRFRYGAQVMLAVGGLITAFVAVVWVGKMIPAPGRTAVLRALAIDRPELVLQGTVLLVAIMAVIFIAERRGRENAAVGPGAATADALTGLVAPGIGLLFLLLTTLLLVLDLKRPERFLYLIFKPNPRSWLVLGAFVLFAAGLLGGLWLLAGLASSLPALSLLAWPTAVVAAATAGYSAFLFGQAEGRDFWQSPLLLPHLLVAAAVAGSASLLLAARVVGSAPIVVGGLGLVLWGSLLVSALVLIAELCTGHATRDAARAAELLTRGPLRAPLWGGVVGMGIVLPLVLLLSASVPFGSELAAVLALGGLWLWEELWIRAGQAIPLS